MIINSQNKDSILRGIERRGFNKTPKEIKEKIYNDLHSNKISKEVIQKTAKPKEDFLKYKNAFNNLNKKI